MSNLKIESSWKGGSVTLSGYKVVYRNKMRIFEHRAIMESHLGRFLRKEEIIHHINHNKLDNRIENLQITSKQEHTKIHAIGRWSLKYKFCVYCTEKSRCHEAHGLCMRCYQRVRKKTAINLRYYSNIC